MNNLPDMIWIELRKALRSRMPLWTSLGSLFMPLGIAFLIFVSRNPQVSQKLGLVSAKADLVAFAAADWPTYLSFFGQLVAAGEFFLLVFAISWVFGREFADGTLKDILAVPVQRFSILLAKFIVTALWSVLLTVVIFTAGMAMGGLLKLPGGSAEMIFQNSRVVLATAGLVVLVVLPFAFFASFGRGYLLPIAAAIMALMLANLALVLGRGEYFPWAIPMIYAEGKSLLPPASYWIALFTGLAGVLGTYLWWKYADQNR